MKFFENDAEKLKIFLLWCLFGVVPFWSGFHESQIVESFSISTFTQRSIIEMGLAENDLKIMKI